MKNILLALICAWVGHALFVQYVPIHGHEQALPYLAGAGAYTLGLMWAITID